MQATAKAEDVARIMGNALLHAGKDCTLPALTAVRVEYEEGTLTAVATDRYTLGLDTASAEGAEAFAFLIDRDDVVRIVKACKDHAKAWRNVVGGPTVTLTVEDERLTVETPSQRIIAIRVDSEFPRYRALIPTAAELAEATGANHVAYSAANLARFAKVTSDSRNEPVRFYIAAHDKKAIVRIGSTFLGILMPVRRDWTCDALNSEDSAKSWQRCSHAEGHAGDHSWHVAPVAVAV